MATVAVIGTFDTKGGEHQFVAEQIRARGHDVLLIDVGTLQPPTVPPDISRAQVAAAGNIDLPELAARRDRGASIEAMSTAAPILLARLAQQGKIDAVISLGGGGGTSIGTAAMRALPIGMPKVMVSTLASGNTADYVGVKDIVMIPSIVDVAGLNRISRRVFAQAAAAVCAMVETEVADVADRPLIVASQFGNTTECVDACRELLEQAGYEVLVFHATGAGGRTMESLIESGMVAGVLDITTTEIADELVGGVLTAGPHRLEAAARGGVPAIVTPGCLDMVNFGSPESVPERYRQRSLYQHNPQVTLMRTTPAECKQLGRIIAEKLNASTAPVTLLIPTKAISIISAQGQAFYDPEADEALFASLKHHLRADIPIVEADCEINSPDFAGQCVAALLQNISGKSA
jgi:uncharacterized protein (UPF0261 family)